MKKTPLYEKHVALGARMIDFGGWALPVSYTGVVEEHRATRCQAGLFDVCHMGELDVEGRDAFPLLQLALTRDLTGLVPGRMRLSLMVNEGGGALDDLTVYCLAEERFRLVANAVNKDKVLGQLEAIRRKQGLDGCSILDVSDGTAKLDLQGPRSETILQRLVPRALAPLRFYHAMETSVGAVPALISRSGYTGEDGFEIYVAAAEAGHLWDRLLEAGAEDGLRPAGLGARDTLRLEAGFMLYGNELDESVNPFETVYGRLVDFGKVFVGRDALLAARDRPATRRLVGFALEGRGIARHGYEILREGRVVGVVTSGSFAPTLEQSVGMAFVPPALAEPGTALEVRIRSNRVAARVVPLPFYKRT